jgi:uncharacterized protein (DUF1786 family)
MALLSGASGGIFSGPEALAVFHFLIACLISVFDGRLRFIFSSSSALLISGVTSGGGLFSSPLKCSQRMQKLQRNRTIVSGCKGAEQNTSNKTIESCR